MRAFNQWKSSARDLTVFWPMMYFFPSPVASSPAELLFLHRILNLHQPSLGKWNILIHVSPYAWILTTGSDTEKYTDMHHCWLYVTIYVRVLDMGNLCVSANVCVSSALTIFQFLFHWRVTSLVRYAYFLEAVCLCQIRLPHGCLTHNSVMSLDHLTDLRCYPGWKWDMGWQLQNSST